jgi:hypothetical protein
MFTEERIKEIFFGKRKITSDDIRLLFELSSRIERVCSEGKWMSWSNEVRNEFVNQVILSGERINMGIEKILNIIQSETWLGSSIQFNNIKSMVKYSLEETDRMLNA